MFGQEPQAGGAPAADAGATLLHQLELLGWVDRSALAVLLVFFVVGLFKGLFWQVSRIAILLIAYGLAGRFGGDFGRWLARDVGGAPPPDPAAAAPGAAPVDVAVPESTLYLAYLAIFLAVLVVLGLITLQLQKLVKKTGLGFFDRVGGGLFGIATGACTVLFGLFVINMFFRDTGLWQDAEASHSQRLSRRAIDWLGPRVPDDVRNALELSPLDAGAPAPAPDSPLAPLPDAPGAPGDPGREPPPAQVPPAPRRNGR